MANAHGSSADTSNSRLCVTRVSADRAGDADAKADADRRQRVAHDHRQHVVRARAERHADADLAALLRDRVRDDAVQAERGEQRGDARRRCRSARPAHVNPDRLRFQISSIVRMSASASSGSICLTASRIAGTAAAASPAVCTDSLTCMRGACAIGT